MLSLTASDGYARRVRKTAGLNNIVGLKPSLGAVSNKGVVPACSTLDCVCVFAGTRRIIDKAKAFSAADAFAGLYRLEALRAATQPLWRGINALAVPTTPCAPTLREIEADPLGPNSKLGTYTNFVNLLDLAAIAVPGPMRTDGRAAGITLIGPRGCDAALASLGRLFHAAHRATIGATGHPLPPPSPMPTAPPAGMLELAAVGAHLSGRALNQELIAAGGVFLRAIDTEPCYELYALPGVRPTGQG
jgi:allophanate hydrolase